MQTSNLISLNKNHEWFIDYLNKLQIEKYSKIDLGTRNGGGEKISFNRLCNMLEFCLWREYYDSDPGGFGYELNKYETYFFLPENEGLSFLDRLKDFGCAKYSSSGIKVDIHRFYEEEHCYKKEFADVEAVAGMIEGKAKNLTTLEFEIKSVIEKSCHREDSYESNPWPDITSLINRLSFKK